jgi:thiol-disulfide isomerase/thioredoxin
MRPRRAFLLLIILRVLLFSETGATHLVRIDLDAGPGIPGYLFSFYGERTIPVDSVLSDASGSIRFIMPDDRAPGLYQVRLPGNRSLKLFYNNEDIHLRTSLSNLLDSLVVIRSEENTIFYGYLRLSRDVLYRSEILEPVMNYYPRNTDFFSVAAAEAAGLVRKEQEYIEKLEADHPNSLAGRYILFTRTPIPDPLLPPEQKDAIRRQEFFSGKDFNDTVLLQTDAIPGKIIEYLAMYRNQALNFDQQEAAFINAVDSILLLNVMHEEIFAYVIQYLVAGFERFKFEKVLDHIYTEYLPMISCTDESVKNDLEKRLAQYSKITPGAQAPDFTIPDTDGNPIHLYGIPSEKILLIFWASWCPHCKKELETLRAMFDHSRPTSPALPEVIAISVDSEMDPWIEEIVNNGYTWTNCAELKGWNGPAVSSYYIYATPTFILLGPDKKIIARSGTISEISKYF